MAIAQPRTGRFSGAAADSLWCADRSRCRQEDGSAAAAEARKNSWNMAIAIVDTGGHLVYFEKMDNTQTGSVNVAIDKARSAALFRRPTKVFQDGVAAGGEGLRLLGLEGAVPIDGGVPIIVGGRIIGGIGTSGGSGEQDGQVARAGADSVK